MGDAGDGPVREYREEGRCEHRDDEERPETADTCDGECIPRSAWFEADEDDDTDGTEADAETSEETAALEDDGVDFMAAKTVEFNRKKAMAKMERKRTSVAKRDDEDVHEKSEQSKSGHQLDELCSSNESNSKEKTQPIRRLMVLCRR